MKRANDADANVDDNVVDAADGADAIGAGPLDCRHLTMCCSNTDRLRVPAILQRIVDAAAAGGAAAVADGAVAAPWADAASPGRMSDAAASVRRTSCTYSCSCCTMSMLPVLLPKRRLARVWTRSTSVDGENAGIYAQHPVPVPRLWWRPNRCCCRWPPKRTKSVAVDAATTAAAAAAAVGAAAAAAAVDVGWADGGAVADAAIDVEADGFAADAAAVAVRQTYPHRRWTPVMKWWMLRCADSASVGGMDLCALRCRRRRRRGRRCRRRADDAGDGGAGDVDGGDVDDGVDARCRRLRRRRRRGRATEDDDDSAAAAGADLVGPSTRRCRWCRG